MSAAPPDPRAEIAAAATGTTPPVAADLDALLPRITQALAARAAEHDRDGSFPTENFALLHRHGLLALTVPQEAGGGGADLAATRKVVAAVARGEPSTALILVMQYLFQAGAAQRTGWPEALRRRVQDDAVTRGALGNALRVEPDLGTPARGGLPGTIARRASDGWRVSGHKLYSTGIPGLTWLGVWGRTDEAEPRIGTFLVPWNAPGIRIVESWNPLGMRASSSHEVILEDVAIPDSHAVDIRTAAEWGAGLPPLLLSWGSVLIAALYDGIARNARDWLVRFAATRAPANLGAALSTLPRFQEAVGEIDALLYTNQVLLDAATAAIDAGDIGVVHAGFLKFTVGGNAIKVAEKALELTGNPGLGRQNPLERHYRDILCSRIHTPQNDSVLTGAGRAAFAGFAAGPAA